MNLKGTWEDEPSAPLQQGWELFLRDGLDSKYCRLWSCMVSVTTTQLCFVQEGSHRLHLNEWTWLWANTTSFTKKLANP